MGDRAVSDVAGNVTPMPSACAPRGGTSKEGVFLSFTRADAPAVGGTGMKEQESGSDPDGSMSIRGLVVEDRGYPRVREIELDWISPIKGDSFGVRGLSVVQRSEG